jgi:hypothetical protein
MLPRVLADFCALCESALPGEGGRQLHPRSFHAPDPRRDRRAVEPPHPRRHRQCAAAGIPEAPSWRGFLLEGDDF